MTRTARAYASRAAQEREKLPEFASDDGKIPDMPAPGLSHARFALAFVFGLAGLLSGGCARPYAGPKTLAAIGTTLLVGGGTTWVAGARQDRSDWATAGLITTAIGVGAVIAAGGWLAASIACEEDPDCPRNEECKEVPAPPGGVPYRQCVRRSSP